MNRLVSWPIARATLRARRRSAVLWFVGIVFAIAGALGATREGAGIETFSGPAAVWFALLTFAFGSGILSEEIESGHAQLVLLRPLSRSAWYGGRLAGAWLSVAIFCVVAWAATFAVAVSRGAGFDPMRFAALGLALLWCAAWLSVLACLSAFLRSWTNAGALIVAALFWTFLIGIVGVVRPALLPFLQSVTKYLGPQDPLVLVDRTRPRLDFGPALYDVVWLFAAWLAGVVILNRRELARRRA